MLKNKNAIVTGCNRGIGRVIVEELAKNGANVWACARTPNAEFEAYLAELSAKYNVWLKPVYFDLCDAAALKSAVQSIFKEKLPVDILVNCAGVAHGGIFQMTPIATIKDVFETNFFAPMALTQQVLKIMLRQKSGNIINFSSIAGQDLKVGNCAYGVSKAAIAAWSKAISAELAPYGIRVNAVAPGLTKTDMADLMNEKALVDGIESSAMKRIATPTEIADVVVFLASEKSSFVNGQNIRIDGGGGVLITRPT